MLGVVAALPAEARAFSNRRQPPGTILQVSDAVMVHQSGVGRHRADAAARALADRGAVALVSWGLAGGIESGCQAGDLLLPRYVALQGGRRVPVDEEWRRRVLFRVRCRLRVHEGDQLESECVLRDAAARAERSPTGVAGVDMESGAVASVASSLGLPFLVVRCVSDPVDLEIPLCALAGVRLDGTMNVRAVLAGVVRRPRELTGLLRLWRSSSAALRALRTVAHLTDRKLR